MPSPGHVTITSRSEYDQRSLLEGLLTEQTLTNIAQRLPSERPMLELTLELIRGMLDGEELVEAKDKFFNF